MRWEGDVPASLQTSKCEIVKVPFTGFTNHTRCASYVNNFYTILESENFDFVVGFNRMPHLDLYYCADVCYVDDIRHRRSPLHKLTPRHKIYANFENAVFSPESKTAILALSEIQQKIYIKEYGTQSERFFPIPAGINKAFVRSGLASVERYAFRQNLGLNDGDTMLLMVGSDFARKGVDRSIRAIAALSQETRNKTKLFVAGKGKRKRFLRLAQSLGAEENVVFLGAVENVPDMLAAADLLLHPAYAENTGNAIVEALIAGVPVLTLSNCGYAFHVKASRAGAVVDGWDFSQDVFNAELANLLRIMPEKREQWHKSAIAYSDVTDFYTRPQVVADIIAKLADQKNI
jgi:UDP-glucose:(heptosyl)LPS alpha-1,3-glucosyltransferase